MKNFTTLVEEGFKIYKQKIASILILMLIFSGLIMILSILISFISPEGIIENGGYLAVLLIFGIYLLMIFLSTFIGFSLVLLVTKPVETKLKEIFQEVWKKLWQYLLVTILVGFFMMTASFLLIIPGIIVGVYLAFSSFAFIIEGEKGINALKRSWDLVNGNWWKVFGRIILLNIIIGVIYATLILINDSLGNVFQCLSMPFGIIFMYLIYLELKKSKGIQVPTQIQPQV